MKCDNCDHDIQIGEWPYCPHAHATGSGIGTLGQFTPYWDHGMGGGFNRPVYIDSIATRNRLMRDPNTPRADGKPRGYRLEHRGRDMGMPGVEI